MGGKSYEGQRGGGGGGGSQNDVIDLTDANFRQLVLHSEDIWCSFQQHFFRILYLKARLFRKSKVKF